ncbi:MAG: hypothetical protein V4598_01425 [Bdellovibrionota bacterium]
MKKIILLAPFLISLTHAATVGGFEIESYGFIKASSMYADKALSSYNNINLSAPTNATAQTRSQDKTSRMSFQAAQSRLGAYVGKDKVKGHVEFDFIDFAKSSPAQQMVPRVRIAAISYSWGDGNRINIGQDWDLFSPTTAYTYDIVGLYFLAGNTGFMRQQAQYLKTSGKWEFATALGMAGNNPGVTDNDLELGKSPTYSGRITHQLDNGKVGISAIYSTLHYVADGENGTSHDSYGANLFYEKGFSNIMIKAETYYGQNMANIGTLAIGKGNQFNNVREFGGMLSANIKTAENQAFFGGLGLAKVDNKNAITPFALTGTAPNVSIKDTGIRSNFLSRVGYEYKITPDFSWMTEASRYETTTRKSLSSTGTLVAFGLESGVILKF